MGTPGRLTKDNTGFSMPGHAPLYPKPPYVYRDATLLVFKYYTDAQSAARMVPAQAELADVEGKPGKAEAGLVFANYPESDLGPYLEVVQYLNCTYLNKPVQFATHLYVTTDVAMAAGREMGGYPKKIADIRIEGDATYRAFLSRPVGQPLASATLTGLGPAIEIPAADSVLKYLCVRLIPSPTKGAPPSLAELLLSDWEILPGATMSVGKGTCQITGTSTADPLHFAPVDEVFLAYRVQAGLRVTQNDNDPSRLRPF